MKIIKMIGIFLCISLIIIIMPHVKIANEIYQHEDINDYLKISYVSGKNENVIFSYNDMLYNTLSIEKDITGNLVFEKGENNIQDIYIWLEDEEGTVIENKINLMNGMEMLDLSELGEGKYNVSFGIFEEEKVNYFVSTGTMFEELISSDIINNQSITQLNDITMNKKHNLNIKYPFTWNTAGHKFTLNGNIIFVSDKNGNMCIQNHSNNDISVSKVYCETPLWDYKISHLFSCFNEKIYYYVNAKTINNKEVDTTKICIKNKKELRRLIEDEKLVLSDQIEHVIFDGDFDLGKVIITDPVNIEFKNNIIVSKGIYFEGNESGNININTSANSSSLNKSLFFNIPLVNVVWEGNGVPSWEMINQYMNVHSFNNELTNKYIAGQGTSKVISGTIDGSTISLEGNFMKITSNYINTVSLNDAKLDLELTSLGNAEIIENDGDYYCVITDNEKLTWGYYIQLEVIKHTLPVVYITTDSGKHINSKTDYVNAEFSIDYNGNGDYKSINKESIRIRGRGNSTWKLDKKPYKIKFEEKQSLFGLEEGKEWVLLANHIDRSLMRNTLALEVAKVADNIIFVPSSYPVDVFINGVYQGVYSLGEQVEMKKGRIEGEAEKDSTDLDTDYLLEWGGEGEITYFGTNKFSTILSECIEIKYPKEDILTKEQFNYISQHMNKVDEAVRNLKGYEYYIDIPSLIDWFLVYEFSYNVDGIFRRSDYFMKKQGDKIYAATPWDFDYAFGNFSLDSNNYNEWICLGNAKTDAYEGKYIHANWITYLIKDENFQHQLKTRWEEIGDKIYQTAIDTINNIERQIGASAEENFKVWNNCLGVKLQYESSKTRELDTYEEQVEYLREFVKNRYQWMDKTIKKM